MAELIEKKFLDEDGLRALWNKIKTIMPEEGLNGQSAYELAKELGFEGTEEEWIESLKGDSGVYVGSEEPIGDYNVWINPEGRVINDTVTSINGQTGDIIGLATEEYVDDAIAAIQLDVPRIEKTAEDTEVVLEPNKFYVFPEMASLSIILGGEVNTAIVQEYKFRFASGVVSTTLILPESIKGDIFIGANSVIEISIIDNYAVSQSWEV